MDNYESLSADRELYLACYQPVTSTGQKHRRGIACQVTKCHKCQTRLRRCQQWLFMEWLNSGAFGIRSYCKQCLPW